jgi:hypothetical protein
MKFRHFSTCAAGLGLLWSASIAWSSEIGQQIADQISLTSYTNYLNNSLYTHNGNNRDGASGAQHNPCRTNIQNILQGFGLTTELQSFSYYGGTRYNVVATQVGKVYPDSHFIIGGHYDSAGTPGADDDASGVAGVLEIARILSVYRTDYTIKYVAFDFEEYGLIGSKAYVNSHPTDTIVAMISLDMIAFDAGNYACDIFGRASSASVKNALRTAVQTYGNGLAANLGGISDNSDHAPFEQAGYVACLMIEQWGNNCYHQACDSVDTANYINYVFARDMTRSVAGYLADNAHIHPLDCNSNGIPDECDVSCSYPGCAGVPGCGLSVDCNGNLFPDECEGGDLCPPTGLLWVQQPTPVGTTAISMSAYAQDPSGVEYEFVASGVGGHSSAWQTAQSYTDAGLEANQHYSYKGKARDQSAQHNESAFTSTVNATTFIETPAALSFGTIAETSIQVTAPDTFTRLTGNLSGLFFEVTALDGTPVGGAQANTWLQAQTITATGLTVNTPYRFRVKARNYYGVNVTPWYPASGYVNQPTAPPPCTLLGDTNGDGAVNGRDIDAFVRAKLGAAPLLGENQRCANYGGTLEQDIAAFAADLLGL